MKTKKERLVKVLEVTKGLKKMKLDGFEAIDKLNVILRQYLDSNTIMVGKIDFPEFNKLIRYSLPVDGNEPIVKIVGIT